MKLERVNECEVRPKTPRHTGSVGVQGCLKKVRESALQNQKIIWEEKMEEKG